MEKKPKAIDIFSGAGGLSVGLQQAGFDVIGAVEIDALACRTFRLNHLRTTLWQTDISRLSGTAMMSSLDLQVGDLDLLAVSALSRLFDHADQEWYSMESRFP
jgi:DNA (cytosine-5)-methyltransferase 1